MLDLIRCPRCAKQIPIVSHFCRRCGCATLIAVPPLPPPIPARAAPHPPPLPRRAPARRIARPGKPAQKSAVAPWMLLIFALFMGMNFLHSARRVHTPAPQPVPAVRWNVTTPPPAPRPVREPRPAKPPTPSRVGPYTFEP